MAWTIEIDRAAVRNHHIISRIEAGTLRVLVVKAGSLPHKHMLTQLQTIPDSVP